MIPKPQYICSNHRGMELYLPIKKLYNFFLPTLPTLASTPICVLYIYMTVQYFIDISQ